MSAHSGSGYDARLMSWENFRVRFLEEGLAVDVPVAGDPPVVVYATSDGAAIGLRTPITPETTAPISTVESIRVDVQNGELRVFTAEADLFQPFFAFLLDVSNRIQLDGKPPDLALGDALASWRRMLAPSSVMSDELQLGLAGELWTLERLVRARGAAAVHAWTGPDRDAHDFRLEAGELEVKTTSGEKRRHIINRLDQLQPSPGMALYVLSLQLVGAGLGEGWSLGDQVDTLRQLVADDGGPRATFDDKLAAWGWRDADRDHYPRRRRLRTPGQLIPVDDGCPRIVPATLKNELGELANRVGEVTYRVDLEGLGEPDGSPGFEGIVPAPVGSRS